MKKYSVDQFDDLDGWISFYKKENKFPHNQIVCCDCKSSFVSLKGRGKKIIFDAFKNDISKILTQTVCKSCKERNSNLIEKKKKDVEPETEQEREERIEKIRASIPKIDLQKENIVLDLLKDKELCEKHTSDSCLRPDIYLNNDRTCDYCAYNKHCTCPIKKFSKQYEKKYKK